MARDVMNVEKGSKKRFVMTAVDKVLLGAMAVMSVVLIVVSVLQRCGLSMINGTLMLYLPMIGVLVLVGWLAYRLVRKIKNRTVKVAVTVVLALVLALGMVLVSSYLSFMAALTVPQRFAMLTSPSGKHKVVVMRQVDTDESRLNARRAARLEADPDGDAEYVLQDYGYVYRAYPTALGLFYRTNADVEGEVYLAVDAPAEPAEEDGVQKEAPAHGTLMVEWLEEESVAHFYVDSPAVGEGGECTVRF